VGHIAFAAGADDLIEAGIDVSIYHLVAQLRLAASSEAASLRHHKTHQELQ
jgi:hypothetical protein